MSQWLTPEEVERITRKKRWKAQCRVLDARGIKYTRAGAKKDGEPLVRTEDVDANGKARQPERDFKAILERSQRRDRSRAKSWQPTPVAVVIASRRPYVRGGGPRVSGVYFLFDGDVLVYVGKSLLISERMWQHVKDFRRFDSFAYVACPSARMDEAEIYYIRAARPRDNVAYNGADGWRPE